MNNFSTCDIVEKIRDEPYWTISDNKKLPIDINYLIDYKLVRPYSYRNNGLTTLRKIESQPELINTVRTYRLDVTRNRIVMLDIEAYAKPTLAQELLNQIPHSYSETSLSGKGVHILFMIPDVVYYKYETILSNKVVIKGPQRDDLAKSDSNNKPQYELLLSEHFITFTRRAIESDKNLIKENDYNQKDVIQAIDNFISQLIAQAKTNISVTNDVDIKQIDIDNPNVKYIVDNMPSNILNYCFSITLENAKNDLSLYEWLIGKRLNEEIKNQLKCDPPFNDPFYQLTISSNIKPEDIIQATYVLMNNYLEPREKHKQKRGNLPWLLYVAKKSYK